MPETPTHKNAGSPASFDKTTDRKSGGHFNFIAVMVAPRSRVNKEHAISLRYSWLPLHERRFEVSSPASFRHSAVIPVLPDGKSFQRLANPLDDYAGQRNWDLQPVAFAYRPAALDPLIGEGGLIKTLISRNRKLPVTERIVVDVTTYTESIQVLEHLDELCVSVLHRCKLSLSAYEKVEQPRFRVPEMIKQYPFLVHHIFDQIPSLCILRHRARVAGVEGIVAHIRYEKNAISSISTDRLYREECISVIG